MLIKRFDEIISGGTYDLEQETTATVSVVEPGIASGDSLVTWTPVPEAEAISGIPLSALHYNDAADSSNSMIMSWQQLYISEQELAEAVVYKAGSNCFSGGKPSFGGIAKTAIYLRYSEGFLNWLKTFDPQTAEQLRNERPFFETVMEDRKKKKLPAKWHSFKADKNLWYIPVVCKLANGKYIGLFLKDEAKNEENLEEIFDLPHSLELMDFLKEPEACKRELIDIIFQMGSGLGRNPFGQEYKLEEARDSEYRRLFGHIPDADRNAILEIWSKKLEYKVRTIPDPTTSALLYLPGKNVKYSVIKDFVDHENEKKALFFSLQEKKKKSSTEDSEQTRLQMLNTLPVPKENVTLYLVMTEGSQKKKLIVLDLFENISLPYLRGLNRFLLQSNLQGSVTEFMRIALTGQFGGKDMPTSSYRYWTNVFTSAIRGYPVSGREVWNNLQRFIKVQSTEKLLGIKEYPTAWKYFEVIGKLCALNVFIETAQNEPDKMGEFFKKLQQDKALITREKGVFNMTGKKMPSAEFLVGDVYARLREKERERLDRFIQMSYGGIPEEDFALFVRGALTGMLLNSLTWCVQEAGRSFTATQGRQPARLRGPELQAVFTKGLALLKNLEKAQLFNCETVTFIKSIEQESMRNAFNSGLVFGLVYYEKKQDNTENKQEA